MTLNATPRRRTQHQNVGRVGRNVYGHFFVRFIRVNAVTTPPNPPQNKQGMQWARMEA